MPSPDTRPPKRPPRACAGCRRANSALEGPRTNRGPVAPAPGPSPDPVPTPVPSPSPPCPCPGSTDDLSDTPTVRAGSGAGVRGAGTSGGVSGRGGKWTTDDAAGAPPPLVGAGSVGGGNGGRSTGDKTTSMTDNGACGAGRLLIRPSRGSKLRWHRITPTATSSFRQSARAGVREVVVKTLMCDLNAQASHEAHPHCLAHYEPSRRHLAELG